MLALKKAEGSDEVILRMVELDGKPAANVKVDTALLDMLPGDVLLLCCDGLHGLIKDQKMAEVLAQGEDLQTSCKLLVEAALAAGGTDNVTVVLARWRRVAGHLRQIRHGALSLVIGASLSDKTDPQTLIRKPPLIPLALHSHPKVF